MPPIRKENNLLTYKGSNFLKQRLILSVLSGKSIKIVDIRNNHAEPGVREYEIGLVRLIDKITNGTKIELNKSGTSILFIPGLLNGGTFIHDCCIQKGIGYYLDVLVALGPFCKIPLNVTLRGVTNSKESPSVDYIKSATTQVLKLFSLQDSFELKVCKRGLMPLGGGEVLFKCPVRKNLRSIQFVDPGMVKRIRGIVYACKVSPSIANRIVESAKGTLLNFLPDVYIQTDQTKGNLSGNSPGFGVNLLAETTQNVIFSAECNSNIKGEDASVPEDLGREVALKLLDEIYQGGCVDSSFQWLVILFMALGQKNVSKYLTGPLSQYTRYFLQHLKDFFAITFKLQNQDTDDSCDLNSSGHQRVLLTCVGIGYTNINKRII